MIDAMRPLAALALTLLCGSAPGASDADAARHAVVDVTMHLTAAPERATAAFGPLAEAAWAPEFRPRFVYPVPGAHVAGAVFRTPDGRVWLLHDFDPAAGLVQYVISGPSDSVTLTIRVSADGTGSNATMHYDMVALDDAGAAHHARMRQHYREIGEETAAAVNAYLAGTANPEHAVH